MISDNDCGVNKNSENILCVSILMYGGGESVLGTPRGSKRMRIKHRMTVFNTQFFGDFCFFLKTAKKILTKQKQTLKLPSC